MNNHEWELAFVLPNITLSTRLETPLLALLPPDDDTIEELKNGSDRIKRFLDSFINEMSHQVKPSALVVNKVAPSSVNTLEALTAFRNAVALSFIVEGSLRLGDSPYPAFSDHFDFYPYSFTRNYDLINYIPGGLSFIPGKNTFIGTCSPYLPKLPKGGFNPDRNLLECLYKVWHMLYVLNINDRAGRVLFRSLEMAYSAASTPYKNINAAQDYGIRIALWVSALEILFGKGHVISELGKYEWAKNELNNQSYTYKNRNYNLIQFLCTKLYGARNNFMHGNRIGKNDLVFNELPFIPVLAPAIYRAGVWSYLNRLIEKENSDDTIEKDLSKIIAERWHKTRYENDLLQIINHSQN